MSVVEKHLKEAEERAERGIEGKLMLLPGRMIEQKARRLNGFL